MHKLGKTLHHATAHPVELKMLITRGVTFPRHITNLNTIRQTFAISGYRFERKMLIFRADDEVALHMLLDRIPGKRSLINCSQSL